MGASKIKQLSKPLLLLSVEHNTLEISASPNTLWLVASWCLIWGLLNGSPELVVPEILWCSQYGLETALGQNE